MTPFAAGTRKRGPYKRVAPFNRRPFEDYYIPEPNTGCWLWIGGLRRASSPNWQYGMFRRQAAHRYSLEQKLGRRLTAGEHACHRCDTPLCVNPDHLFAGTATDNAYDMLAKRRHRYNRRTHCINGHEYTPENIIWRHDRPNSRICRACLTTEGRRLTAERRAGLRRARKRTETHCDQGHAYEPNNVHVYRDRVTGKARRICLACKAIRQQRRPGRRKAS